MRRWGVWFGRFWMVQFALDGTISFGLHIDPIRRHTDRGGFGPYLDLHLGPVIVSLGNHPSRAADDRWLSSVGILRPEVVRVD
jgi:hypothetical protein